MALAGAAGGQPRPRPVGEWKIRFFHDENDRALALEDLKFPTARHGMAVGVLRQKQKIRPVAVVTDDGGENWVIQPIEENPRSLFFLNDSLGWMATDRAVWRTEEGGRSWRKLAGLRGILQLWFTDPERGWAVGFPKLFYRTSDGGRRWERVAVDNEPKTDAEQTAYTRIAFADDRIGAVAGWYTPPRRRQNRFPDWMDPEEAERRRQWPTTSIVFLTNDGGQRWSAQTSSLFGRITRFSYSRGGRGLLLVEFQDAFEWPSEVYSVEWASGRTTRVFREKDRAVKDLLVLEEGDAILAAIEPGGALLQSPIPRRLHILRGSDAKSWREMEVDYRAAATRAILAQTASEIWVATDTGMILSCMKG